MLDLLHLSPIFRTDSYKYSHWKQLPPGTKGVFSYLESRGGKYEDVVFFGLQYLLQQYMQGVRITREEIDEAAADVEQHMGPGVFDRTGWMRVLERHNGRLPILIKALPEGTVTGQHQVLLTVESTDESLPSQTNFHETLLMQLWYPITVASQSLAKRKLMLDYLALSGTPAEIDLKWHDFGYRGSTSQESAAIGGAAHLLSFKGTDTFIALKFIQRYYDGRMEGLSIPASEHSTMASWGREREADAYANMLRQFPSGPVACVSDSYDIYHACSQIWGAQLKEQVEARDGFLVVRPDSGDPAKIVIEVLRRLGERFGYSLNEKGYKLLPRCIRILQGDGITYETAHTLLDEVVNKQQWSADNLTLGEGSGCLQQVNRDTLKMAIKCSAVKIGDKWRDVYKDPVTDRSKRSKCGRLAIGMGSDGLHYTDREENVQNNLLHPVFKDGEVLVTQRWNAVRERVIAHKFLE